MSIYHGANVCLAECLNSASRRFQPAEGHFTGLLRVKTDCETDGLSAALENRNIRNPPTWRDVGAVACAGNHHVGLVSGVEGFTRAGKDI